jgi:RNA polymerase sigma-70 factor (ECF subfamily)
MKLPPIELHDRSDESLVRAFAEEGDEAALDALVARHWERAFRVALRVVREPSTAEDVAQETFVKVAREARRFERDRAFAPWLYAIALNTARNALRSRKRRELHETRASRLRPETSATALESPVEARLATLPEELKVPLLLRYGEELSLEEVASTLGCPVGTASSRIRRGLEKLRAAGVGTGALALFLRPPVKAPAPPSARSIVSRIARTKLAWLASSVVALLATLGAALVAFAPPAPAGAPRAAAPAALVTGSVASVPSAGASAPTPTPSPGAAEVADGEPSPGKKDKDAQMPAPAKAAARAGFLVSRVVGADDGRPIEDAKVVVLPDPGTGPHRRYSRPLTRSGEDGRFELRLGENEFPLKLAVTAPGRRPLVRVYEAAPDEIRLPGDPLSLAGVVVAKGTGLPVPGITVDLEQEGVEVDALTDQAGRFRFEDLAPGPATLKIASGCTPVEETVDVAPGANVTLEVDAASRIAVHAASPQGAAMAFTAEVVGQGSQMRSGDGEIDFDGVPPGEPLQVIVSRRWGDHFLTGIADATFEVTLAPGETKELAATIDTSKDATLEVVALDTRGGPLAGAKLNVRRAPREGKIEHTGLGLDATSGEDGRARFSLPAGRYELRLDNRLVAPVLELSERDSRRVEARRKGDVKLAGVVRDKQGKPIARAWVTFTRPGGDTTERVTSNTDDDGRFTIEGVSPGLGAVLLVWANGFEPASMVVYESERLAGKLTDLEIVLAPEVPKATIKVSLAPPAGSALPAGATVTFCGEHLGLQAPVQDGVATFPIPAGERGRFFVTLPGYATVVGPEIESGQDADVRVPVELVKGRRIQGKILGPGPVKGGYAGVFGTVSRHDAAADGTFAVDDAPLGPFELEVGGEGLAEKRIPIGAGDVEPLVVTLDTRR